MTLVGLPREKEPLSLTDWIGRFHPRDFQRLNGDWNSAIAEQRQDFYAELRCLHASGRWVWLMLRARCTYGLTGDLLKVTGTACDVSHRMTADQLTGMDNRDSLVDQLQSRIDRASIEPKNFAVYFLDLDKFKLINESLGHAVGDQLLVQVADRLMSTVEGTAGCIAARVGGDEFAILVSDLAQETDAVTFGTLLSHVIAMPFYCDGQLIHTSVSVGVSFGSSRHETTAERMLEEADIAMYQAKKQGKGCQVLFRSNMKLAAVERLTIERDLRLAIESEQIEVYYQPKISLDSDRLIGVEALVRWRHPERGLLSPVSFIDIAEETGLISRIGMLVARQAISQLSAWIKSGVVAPSTTVAINLSAKQMRQPQLWDNFQEMCNEVNLPYGNVIIEITESVFIDNSEAVADVLQQCVNIGFGLDLDDFGTGYSSLSYLHRFPFQNVKVNRSFVSQMICDSKSRGVVGSIIHLARSLGMGVVAEGIETPEQSARLQRMGCKVGQGYLFSRPVSAALFENMVSIRALNPPLWKAPFIPGPVPI